MTLHMDYICFICRIKAYNLHDICYVSNICCSYVAGAYDIAYGLHMDYICFICRIKSYNLHDVCYVYPL